MNRTTEIEIENKILATIEKMRAPLLAQEGAGEGDATIPHALDENTTFNLAELFKVLGDQTRIRILTLLTLGERRVGDIADVLEMGHSAVSHQLRVLRTSRLVRARRDGKEAWYMLDDDHVVKLLSQGLEHVSHH